MAYIQLADANTALAKDWAREMMNSRIVLRKMPQWSGKMQLMAIEAMNRMPASIETVRDAYLELHQQDSALLFIETEKLRTPTGRKIQAIAETIGLEYAGIYIDREHTDVFVCQASDATAVDDG